MPVDSRLKKRRPLSVSYKSALNRKYHCISLQRHFSTEYTRAGGFDIT